jgi:hypothetical protein
VRKRESGNIIYWFRESQKARRPESRKARFISHRMAQNNTENSGRMPVAHKSQRKPESWKAGFISHGLTWIFMDESG